MGTWGSGNFESDGALDMLGDLTDEIAAAIDEILANGTADADELGESHLVPRVAILDALCKQCSSSPPEPDRVVGWRDAYLAVYDRSMPELDPTGEFLAERRAVIVATFASLEEEARRFWAS